MKHRWIGGVLVAAMLTLAACAPRQGGADGSASPDATQAATPSPSTAPTDTPGASETEAAEPTPYDY